MLKRLFLSHPRSCGETYGDHALAASRIALALFGAGAAALIHAVAPGLFTTTASRMVARLHLTLAARSAASAASSSANGSANGSGTGSAAISRARLGSTVPAE